MSERPREADHRRETLLFLRPVAALWREAERIAFVDHTVANPEAGDVILGTGGVRKVRWKRAGKGKRGGTRVICFHHDDTMPLYLLLIHAKSQREGLIVQAEAARLEYYNY
jgi:hypothetical protein